MQLFHRRKNAAAIADRHACPRCGDVGVVQVVDLVLGVDVIQCRPCRFRWESDRSVGEKLNTAS